MSLKIFTLQLTGKMGDAARIEQTRHQLEETYRAFLEAGKSPEFQRYTELDGWVASGTPEQRRLALQKEVFKGSPEFHQEKEFHTLAANRKIRDFLKMEGSADLARFLKLEDSEKLKNYWELKDYAEGEFQREMREINSRKFVGSPEERLLKELAKLKKNKGLKAYFRLKDSAALKKHQEFRNNPKLQRFLAFKSNPPREKEARSEWNALKNDPEIRDFFRMEKSSDLKLYHKMEGRHVIARFEELTRETGTEEFRQKVTYLKDPRKLEKSDAWKKFRRYKELGTSDDVVFFRKFKKSPLYRNYLDMKDSFQLGRFRELKTLMASAAFREKKTWLEDARKWEKSEEYAQLQEFLRLKKHPKVALYNQYKEGDHFRFLQEWEVTFSDRFDGQGSDGKWIFNTLWGERFPGTPFSQPGDLQGYSGGRNTLFKEGRLAIQVRREKVAGKRWQPGAGFVPTDFAYSSDLLSTAGRFAQKEGIFEVKVKFSPVPEVVSSCHLLGEEPGHQLTLVETGPQPRLGVLVFSGNEKPRFEGVDLKHLKRDKFYIFRLEWEGSHFTWKINDCPVFETRLSKPDGPVHFNLLSLVVGEIPGSRLPVNFEVGWVRCYGKKNG